MSLARSFSIYTASSVLAGATPIVLLPVLTRHLSDADYGSVATVTTLIAFLTPAVMWGTHALVAVEYHRCARADFARFFSTLLYLPLLASVLLLVLALLVATPAAALLQVPPAWIVAAPAFALLTWLPTLQLTLLRMRDRALTYGALEVASAVVSVATTYLFVVGLDQGWPGRLYSVAAVGALLSVVALAWLIRTRSLVPAFDGTRLREALRFGAGVVPHDLFNQVIRLADRLMIVALAGLASAGQYAIAAQVTSVMLVLLSAFNRAWSPYLFSLLPSATPQSRREIVRKSYLAMAGFAAFFVLFNAATPLLYHLLIDPKFHASKAYVPWLSLGYLFTAVYLTYVDYIFYEKKTHLLSAITFCNMSLNLLLNYALIGRYGPLGAAMAFACTMFVVMLLAFAVSSRVHRMPWFHWLRREAT